MYTASEARKKTNWMEVKRSENEKKMLEKGIEEAIQSGKYGFKCNSELSRHATEWLKELGYILEKEENGYMILW